ARPAREAIVPVQRERVTLVGIGPELLPRRSLGVLQTSEGIARPSGEAVSGIASHDDFDTARLAVQRVDPGPVIQARLNHSARRQPRLGARCPQDVTLLTRIDVEEKAGLVGKRLLNPGIEVQRALGTQVWTSTLKPVNLIEARKLTIHT